MIMGNLGWSTYEVEEEMAFAVLEAFLVHLIRSFGFKGWGLGLRFGGAFIQVSRPDNRLRSLPVYGSRFRV